MKIRKSAPILWAFLILMVLQIPLISYGQESCFDLFKKIEADNKVPVKKGNGPLWNLSKPQLIELIKKLDAEIDVNGRAIQNDKSEAGRKIMLEMVGVEVNASTLYTFIVVLNKVRWTDFLAEAQLSGRVRRQNNVYNKLSDAHLIELIQALDKVIDVNSDAIQRDKSEVGRKIVLEFTGVEANASTLYSYMTVVKKWNWGDWLIAAHLSGRIRYQTNTYQKLSDTRLIELTQALDKKIDVSGEGIQNDRSATGRKVIAELIGVEANAATLYWYITVAKNIQWRDWLEIAKLEHRVGKEYRKLSDEEIILVIKTLYDGNYQLNSSAMQLDNTVATGNWLKSSTGIYITPSRVLRQIRNKANSSERVWDAWLMAAGLNPNEIRLKGSTPAYLLSAAMKGELDSSYQALARGGVGFEGQADGTVKAVAIDNRTPEMMWARDQFYEALRKVVDDLSPRQEELFEMMLNYFEIHSYSEIAGLGGYLRAQIKPAPADAEWQSLLIEIGKHEELRELLLDMF